MLSSCCSRTYFILKDFGVKYFGGKGIKILTNKFLLTHPQKGGKEFFQLKTLICFLSQNIKRQKQNLTQSWKTKFKLVKIALLLNFLNSTFIDWRWLVEVVLSVSCIPVENSMYICTTAVSQPILTNIISLVSEVGTMIDNPLTNLT